MIIIHCNSRSGYVAVSINFHPQLRSVNRFIILSTRQSLMNFNSQDIRIEQTFSGTKSKVNHTMTKKNKQREIEFKSNKEGFLIYACIAWTFQVEIPNKGSNIQNQFLKWKKLSTWYSKIRWVIDSRYSMRRFLVIIYVALYYFSYKIVFGLS